MTSCAAGLSAHPLATQATGEVLGEVLERIGEAPDLAVLFASTAHTGAVEDIVATVRQILRPGVLVGCTSASVVGGAQEIEDAPALSLFAARFGGAGPAEPVRLQAFPGADGLAIWGLPEVGPEPRTLVLLTDPFSFPADQLLDGLAEGDGALTVLGGLAAGARGPGGNRLVLDGAVHDDGAVGVLLPAGLATTTVVSQGCRPIGDPMVVTRSEGTLLDELASEPALPRLQRLIGELTDAERTLASRGLHIGRVVDERKATFGRGDFLVRNVLGAVRERDAVAVGDEIEIGTTVQFQVRDAVSADDDLRALLGGSEAAGALLFTCSGRGTHLFGRPHHDAALVDATTPGSATAGMACAGEIGPVGGRAFLHGFTASVLLFDP
ncbi:MAG: FIST C-terminal domain-containing protein [Acidimicrobiia bacterium]|nr:FIST C-terminal domain-containing protein [Acidimicrobiia bacterium]